MRSISEVLAQAESYLTQKQIDSPRLSAQVILAHVLGCDRTFLFTHPEKFLTSSEYECFWSLTSRRAGGEPVAYILGQKEFYSLNFKVNPHVLSPGQKQKPLLTWLRKFFPETRSLFLQT